MNNINTGVGLIYKSSPVISFYSLIDEDMSLIKYVIKEFRNKEVFDLEKISNMTYMQILSSIYKRKYKNPLYFLSKDEKYNDFLDECYEEFISLYEKDILNYAVSTEMMNVIIQFKKSGDIVPYILYYNDTQKDFIESIDRFRGINTVSLEYLSEKDSDIGNRKQLYTQFYFKYFDEIDPFKDLIGKTYYFSTCGLNLNDDNSDIKENDLIIDLIKRNNKINLFDMYRMDILGRY